MRKIMVTGFLGSDAQKQISKQNREYVTFNIANREYNDPKGADGLTETTWIRVTSFNPQLNTFASNLKKGSNVTVIGNVNVGTYQNKMGGVSVDIDVIADSIAYTSGDNPNKNNNTNSGNSYGGGTTPNQYSMPQASMPKATSAPTATMSVPTSSAQPTASAADDDDLPF